MAQTDATAGSVGLLSPHPGPYFFKNKNVREKPPTCANAKRLGESVNAPGSRIIKNSPAQLMIREPQEPMLRPFHAASKASEMRLRQWGSHPFTRHRAVHDFRNHTPLMPQTAPMSSSRPLNRTEAPGNAGMATAWRRGGNLLDEALYSAERQSGECFSLHACRFYCTICVRLAFRNSAPSHPYSQCV